MSGGGGQYSLVNIVRGTLFPPTPGLRKPSIWPKIVVIVMIVYKLLMKTLGKKSLSTLVNYQPLYDTQLAKARPTMSCICLVISVSKMISLFLSPALEQHQYIYWPLSRMASGEKPSCCHSLVWSILCDSRRIRST